MMGNGGRCITEAGLEKKTLKAKSIENIFYICTTFLSLAKNRVRFVLLQIFQAMSAQLANVKGKLFFNWLKGYQKGRVHQKARMIGRKQK